MAKLFSSGQVATMLGISRDTLHMAFRLGEVAEPEAGKINNRRIFSETDIERLRDHFGRRVDRRKRKHRSAVGA